MPDYAVHTRFTASEQVSATYRRMGKAADGFRRRTSTAFRNATKEGYRFGTIVKGILAANIIYGGIGAITGAVGAATDGFLEFDDAMVGAFARFDDLGPKAQNARKGIADLKRETIKAVVGTEHTLIDAGHAMDFFAKANWSSKNSLQALSPMLDMSTAAGENFSETVDMTNDLLGAFDMKVNNSAKQIGFLGRMTDVLTRAGIDANGGLTDFFETMKMIGPVALDVGASLEDVGAMQVILANAGIKSTKAATGLKHALLNIPGRKMAAEFKANGVAIEDGAGGIRDYFDIMMDIEKKTRHLSERTRINLFERIFGLYGISAGSKMLQSIPEMQKARDRLLNAKGTTKEISDFQRKYSLQIKIMMFKNAALEKSFEVFEAFKYKGVSGIEALAKAIRGWNPERLIEGIRGIWWGLTQLWNVIRPFLPFMPYLIAYFLTFNVALKGLMLLQTVMLLGRMFKAMVLAKGAMYALNMVIAANPIGLIATGIALAVVGLIFLERKFGVVTTAWEFWSKKVKAFVAWITETPFWKVLAGIGNGMTGAGKALLNMKDIEMNAPAPAAPNTKEAEAKNIRFQGQLNIAGAPEGSTVESKTEGAPPLRLDMMGVAP